MEFKLFFSSFSICIELLEGKSNRRTLQAFFWRGHEKKTVVKCFEINKHYTCIVEYSIICNEKETRLSWTWTWCYLPRPWKQKAVPLSTFLITTATVEDIITTTGEQNSLAAHLFPKHDRFRRFIIFCSDWGDDIPVDISNGGAQMSQNPLITWACVLFRRESTCFNIYESSNLHKNVKSNFSVWNM